MLLAVAVDADGSPVSVSWSGDTRRNIIVWMDHRAVNQAERINASNSPVLQDCGGGVSPEMQAPKVRLVYFICMVDTMHISSMQKFCIPGSSLVANRHC
jgi:ribulose kinase